MGREREGRRFQKTSAIGPSARIVNVSAAEGSTTVGRRGGKAGSYDDWLVAALRKRARELEIDGRSTLTKSELVDALRSH